MSNEYLTSGGSNESQSYYRLRFSGAICSVLCGMLSYRVPMAINRAIKVRSNHGYNNNAGRYVHRVQDWQRYVTTLLAKAGGFLSTVQGLRRYWTGESLSHTSPDSGGGGVMAPTAATVPLRRPESRASGRTQIIGHIVRSEATTPYRAVQGAL